MVDENGTVLESTVPGFDGPNPWVPVGVVAATRTETGDFALISRCDAAAVDLENALCAPTARYELALVEVRAGGRASLIATSDTFAGGDTILGASTGQESGLFNVLVRSEESESTQLLSVQADTGLVVESVGIDPDFAADSTICITSDRHVFAAGGLDKIVVRSQMAGTDRADVVELPLNDGWFDTLRCGESNAFLITSYGAVYTLAEGNMPSQPSLAPSPLNDRSSIALSIIDSVSAGQSIVVAGSRPVGMTTATLPGGAPMPDDGDVQFYSAALDGTSWSRSPDSLLQVRWGRLAFTFDGADLLPVGTLDENGQLYSID